MLLMVATSRHHGLPALPDSKDGLQGAFFNLWTPRPPAPPPPARHHALGPPPPLGGPGRCWGFVHLGLPQRGPGVVGGQGGGWEGGVVGGGSCPGPLRRRPRGGPGRPPTCPFHPTFLSRSAPSSDLAVMESMLFFVGSLHQIEICKGDNVDAESEIHFAMSDVAPPVRPTTLWHLLNTAPAWRSPRCTKAGAWARCPTVRGCIVTPPKWTPLPLPHLPILLGPRRIFMFSMSKIGEDMCLSARMPSVDKVEKSQ